MERDLAELLAAGALELPLPGGGRTAQRWRQLADLGRRDLALAKIAEAHADADAIRVELGAGRIPPGELWAVWAAEAPGAAVRAAPDGQATGGWRVSGRKAWCSGAALCTHALITATADDGPRLMAVDLRADGVAPQSPTWAGPGMQRAGTVEVVLADAPAAALGEPGAYLSRPGFWHGAIGIAAVWLGGAGALAEALLARGRADRLDAHGLAHLGAVDAALAAAWALLDHVAAGIDADPAADRRVDALRARAVAEAAALTVLDRTGRALGPAPFATDPRYAWAAADLPVYLRQSHAERDLAQLGAAVAADSAEPLW